MPRAFVVAVALALVVLSGCRSGPPEVVQCACQGGETVPAHKVGGASPTGSPWNWLAGTSGTATVPAGWYAPGFTTTCGTASACTVVVTSVGPLTQDAAAGPTITVPAGGSIEVGPPVLPPGGLGAGSTLVFTGTVAYVVGLQ